MTFLILWWELLGSVFWLFIRVRFIKRFRLCILYHLASDRYHASAS
jgi:hypothetical protein